MTTIDSLPRLLERSARRDPDAIAVRDGAAVVSYVELDEQADRLAGLLQSLDVRPGDRVGIHLSKSIDAVVAIYAVMRAGAVYVPLDPRSPVARLALIADDCRFDVLLSESRLADRWSELVLSTAAVRTVVIVDALERPDVRTDVVVLTARDVASAEPLDRSRARVVDQDLAYILYTSGSTGTPKGVMLTHRNALAFVDWAVDAFDVGPADVLSSHAPFHFDLSVFDLFAAAHAGASLVLVPPATSMFPAEAARCIRDNGITVWYSVPSILAAMVEYGAVSDGDLPSLRTILFAGEVFAPRYLAALMTRLPDVTFANLYGPTETNVCTAYVVAAPPDPDGPDLPIGRPIANDEAVVVGDHGDVVPDGEIGELYVRGATVMRGYWGDPERTAERLVPDWRPGALGDLLYRTGDIVRVGADGNLRFLGRRDTQVKSRGYRIELGEVENAIGAHPSVVAAAVVAIPDRLVTNRLHAVVEARQPVTAGELAAFCATRVPRYMVPDGFQVRDTLPRTSTGKIDRRQLAADVTTTPHAVAGRRSPTPAGSTS